ncbi:MAG: FAD-dependent oxidoreductase, partial [Burkholderiales bacterium PBB4]
MIRITELKLPLSALPVEVRRAADAPSETDADRGPVAHPVEALTRLCAQALGIDTAAIAHLHVFKRSFDARKADLLAVYIADLALTGPTAEAALLAKFAKHPHIGPTPDMAYRPVAHAPADLQERPIVVGFGPCGMFAALVLAQMGFKPIVLERGKPVRQRTKDTWGLWRKNTLNPESNVQFGEGGAGTFSDGKLYSQIKDPRYLGRKVMEEFVHAGAPAEILYEAHPHIGTFKLVKVVESIREQIIALGGEVRFGQRVADLEFELLQKEELLPHHLRALQVENLQDGSHYTLPARHVVMALGH